MPEIDPPASTPVVPPTATVINQPTNHKKTFLPVAAVAAILLLGSLAFSAYQLGKNRPSPPTAEPLTISPTADWKTYTDSLHGFEFKYPAAEYTIQKNPSNVRLTTKTTYIFEVSWVKTNQSVENWWTSESKNKIPYTMTKAEFRNLPAYYFKLNTKEVQVPMDWYAIKTGNQILTISYEAPFNLSLYAAGEERESYRSANNEFENNTGKIVDQILTTFRFL